MVKISHFFQKRYGVNDAHLESHAHCYLISLSGKAGKKEGREGDRNKDRERQREAGEREGKRESERGKERQRKNFFG